MNHYLNGNTGIMEAKLQPTFIIPIAIILQFTLGIGPNFSLFLLVCSALIIGFYLLWRPGEPQVLLYIFTYQWLQVSAVLSLANLEGTPISALLPGFPMLDKAAAVAITAITVLAIGMRIGARQKRAYHIERAIIMARNVPPLQWFKLHILTLGISIISFFLAANIPGLSQGFLVLANLKWATFVILTIVTFSRPEASRFLWFTVFSVEFLSSFGGYFSSFKTVFIFTLIAITAVGTRITIRKAVAGFIVAATMITLGVYWTAIKPTYRAFISGGEKAQIVTVSTMDAASKIIELVGTVDRRTLEISSEQLVIRFSEIDMLAAVLMHVPARLPHEWGKLWWDSASRPFMPRIFFPSKSIIDESELTQKYSGMNVAGFDQGTQIGMGYIADSYIDFSIYGMWAVLLLFGYLLGRAYRWYIEHPNGYGLLGFGLVSAFLTPAVSIGFSSAKMIGGILVCVIVSALLLDFVIPRYIRLLRA